MQPCSQKKSFRNLSKLLLCFVPLSLGLPGSESTPAPTYQWKDPLTHEPLECQKCPPGTFVAQHCTKNAQTLCKTCPEDHYTHYWNYLEKCRYCNVICDVSQEEAQACNATHNRRCQCKAGYHSEFDFCVRHSKCPVGMGVTQLGTPHEDTQCAACPPGSFSSSVSSTDSCQKHQNCSEQGLNVSVLGNQFHDTFCTACNVTAGGTTKELGSGDCQQAVIDRLIYGEASLRKLRRLKNVFQPPSESWEEMEVRAELQKELHAFLTNRKDPATKSKIKQLVGQKRRRKLIGFEKPRVTPLGSRR